MRSTTGNTKPDLPASSGALVVYRGKILMIKRDNNPKISNPNKWAVPGGRVEKGESFNQALERELQEEINVVPKNYIFCGIFKFINDNVKRAIYFVRLSDKEYKKVRLGNEGQEIDWFSPEEIERIETATEIKNLFAKYKMQIKNAVENKLELRSLLVSLQKDGVLEAETT